MRPISQLNSCKLLSTVKCFGFFFSTTGLFEISSGIKGSISKEQFCLHFKITFAVLAWTLRGSHWDSSVNAGIVKKEEEIQAKRLIILHHIKIKERCFCNTITRMHKYWDSWNYKPAQRILLLVHYTRFQIFDDLLSHSQLFQLHSSAKKKEQKKNTHATNLSLLLMNPDILQHVKQIYFHPI